MKRATLHLVLAVAVSGLPLGAAGPATLGLLTVLAGGTAAAAQGGAGQGDQASPLPSGGTTKSLTVPGAGGVADTGLGGATGGSGRATTGGAPSPDTGTGLPGTGMSVKGPAGQGIGGQGISNGIDAGAGGIGR